MFVRYQGKDVPPSLFRYGLVLMLSVVFIFAALWRLVTGYWPQWADVEFNEPRGLSAGEGVDTPSRHPKGIQS